MENLSLFDLSHVKGEVIRILFQNSDNYYTVIKVDVMDSNEDFDQEVTIVGYLPQIVEGETYLFKGKVTNHPKYGKQLQAETFEKELPQTKQGVIHYLSSDLFKGIGKKTAETIVDKLGEDALQKIIDDPDVLKEIPKLNKQKRDTIAESIRENQAIEHIMIKLNELGFGPKLAMAIYQFYKEETLNIIKQSPYRLVMDINGIGFQRADQIAEQVGISKDHHDRLVAGVSYFLDQQSLQNGHTFLPVDILTNGAYELLNHNQPEVVNKDQINGVIIEMSEENKLIIENDNCFLPSLYYSEAKSVQIIHRLYQHQDELKEIEKSDLQLHIGQIEDMNDVSYADGQKLALETAINHKMMLLTGGPGTGKTTVIRGICELYSEIHGVSLNYDDYQEGTDFPIVLAAPTGRAAKRLSESTGLEAMTIHRLIGWSKDTQPDDVLDNDIHAHLIILDEMSMVDTWLMYQFLRAVPDYAQIIFVGDEDQLPSVGPGQIFKDLIDSKVIPRVNLTEVYRQQEGSSIIDLAHKIKNGLPVSINEKHHDRSFIPCSSNQIATVVEKVVQGAVNKGYNMQDIQVLAPIYRGPAGINKLNELLQDILNPKDEDTRFLQYGDIEYRENDKVLQLINRPDDNVFNGDIGVVTGVYKAEENALGKDVVIVDYEGNDITYTKQDLSEITHAYCCSIHKSQGSEFPIVIMPIVRQYFRMLQKNILYTGLTRAKQSLVVCGEEQAFNQGIQTLGHERMTSFDTKLKMYFDTDVESDTESETESIQTKHIILTEDNMFEIDPMINMNDKTPYDFMK
ncbi:ATP-dependent RecD-like DNA helicase [Mammaliicoccus sciuri]|uniref:SF1B family DNA helicase RecD2 n=1 Tax=Mammaliicoccus sciuri TaxID=1296 RepID=UPI000BBE9973|nr:ATP-dependent RecD-like DNA helicase [Mammaliicoccus sciuri]MCD8823587.1 ATP-dependent RecD-like DNA helicase [Mammaliicoccus sciuri]MCJ0934501.1 ATP-dependent RecD-like DNA helicase [Mammaliicoccus sciuri]MDO0956304.1 ATP-dependent RecD-like DNA helicase [Mammaliicoccus sciuri]MDT0701688.1 ATP-dependent RecD-like DNA helicase [Mammaliicoccus sciuri]MDT0706885.1 ATP-dependent RecD-like DNA helicase [Mammaliicoccus sciuri]